MQTNKACLLLALFIAMLSKGRAQNFPMDAITSYPFPSELTAAATGSKAALAINEKGKRNIYVAEGPEFSLRRLTNYEIDDGQEITSVNVSPDGKWVVYVRGGDHGALMNQFRGTLQEVQSHQ